MTLLPPLVPFGAGVHPEGKQRVRLQCTLGEMLAGAACMRALACWGAVASRGQAGGLRAQAMLYCCCIAASRLPWLSILSTSPGLPSFPAPIVTICSASMASSSQQAQRISRCRACWRCRQGHGWRPLPLKSIGGASAAACDDLTKARPCQLHAASNAMSPGHANAAKGAEKAEHALAHPPPPALQGQDCAAGAAGHAAQSPGTHAGARMSQAVVDQLRGLLPNQTWPH